MKTEGLRFVYALAKVMALILIALPSLASEKEAPPGKAAVVNGSVITQEDLDKLEAEISGMESEDLEAFTE